MLGTTQAQMKISRSSALTRAKNLTITTKDGQTYYYLISSNDMPIMHLDDGSVRIGKQVFEKQDIKSMRFKEMTHLLMDEDSVTFFNKTTLNHDLIGLRRGFHTNKWNTLILPFSLTGEQIKDAFGEDAQLAKPIGFNAEDYSVLDFQSIDLNTEGSVVEANYPYLILPTREPDVASGNPLGNFYSSRVYGPLYLIPQVSLDANQTIPRHQMASADGTNTIRFRGTYYALDGTYIVGSTVKNKKVAPKTLTLDEDAQTFVHNEDSVAVKAFRSWIQVTKGDPQEMKFCIDGIELTDGIVDIGESQPALHNKEGIYDLSGRRITTPTRKGIYIINGKKVAIK